MSAGEALLRLKQSLDNGRTLRQESLILRVARSVEEQEGGAEAFGRNLVEFCNGLKVSNPRLYVQTRKLIIDLFKMHDDTNQATLGLEGVDAEDLKAIAKGLAVDMLVEDPEFREQVLNIVEKQDPVLLEMPDEY